MSSPPNDPANRKEKNKSYKCADNARQQPLQQLCLADFFKNPFFLFLRPLHNTHSVIASAAKQSHHLLIFHEITTSLTLPAMTKNNYAKVLS